MRNKILICLVLLSAIFSLIVPASAEQIILTSENSLPDGFEVTVNTYTSPDRMTLRVTKEPVGFTGTTIDQVFYNLNIGVNAVENGDGINYWQNNIIQNSERWDYATGEGGNRCDGFGEFTKAITGGNNPKFGVDTDLVIRLNGMETFNPNNKNNVCVHLKFDNSVGSTISSFYITDFIPEFPTVALPIAAVIGLVFFFQHKKRKEE
jgi:hypothetical protein